MTPEQRARAAYNSLPGLCFREEAIKTIADAIRAAEADALERAARIADQIDGDHDRWPNAGSAIRSMIPTKEAADV